MGRIVDLTAEIHEGMANHPSHGRSPVFLTGTRLDHDDAADTWRGKGVEDLSLVNGFVLLAEHNGTHIDAPYHLHPDGATVESVPLEECHGPAVRLDVSGVGQRGGIGPDALADAAAAAGVEVRPGDAVLLYTGWAEHLPDDRETYLSDHPGVTADGAAWLRDREVDLVGIDCGNVDIAGDVAFPAHRAFMRDHPDDYTLIVENLRNLDAIPADRFTFSAAPLPLSGATASPVRAFATVD